MKQPDLFQYDNYRDFLKDYYSYCKKTRRNFSYRAWSRKAGINAPAFFKYLIEGKRSLTKQSVVKVIQSLGLDAEAALYFENLVFFNQAETEKERSPFLAAMLSKKEAAASTIRKLNPDEYVYFSEWHHVIIRELVCLKDFKDDYREIGRQITPPISPGAVKNSITLLLKLGLLVKNKDGSYQQTTKLLSGVPSTRNTILWNFQKQMASLGLDAFDRFGPEERSMSGVTVSLSEPVFNIYKEKISSLRKELLSLAENDTSANQVYTLSIQLFPMSTRISEKGNSK